jgi:hypothetical protein
MMPWMNDMHQSATGTMHMNKRSPGSHSQSVVCHEEAAAFLLRLCCGPRLLASIQTVITSDDSRMRIAAIIPKLGRRPDGVSGGMTATACTSPVFAPIVGSVGGVGPGSRGLIVSDRTALRMKQRKEDGDRLGWVAAIMIAAGIALCLAALLNL